MEINLLKKLALFLFRFSFLSCKYIKVYLIHKIYYSFFFAKIAFNCNKLLFFLEIRIKYYFKPVSN
ncbi:hypothetical protein ES708_17193 [subsurface metagenome]